MVTSLSLGKALALVRELGRGDDAPEHVLHAIERLRDRDLLERARAATLPARPDDMVVYTEDDLAELRA